MKASAATLDRLSFESVLRALSDRAATALGVERAVALRPDLSAEEVDLRHARVAEIEAGDALPLGGIEDVRELVAAAREGRMLEGREILSVAHTLDATGDLKRAILGADQPELAVLAEAIGSFDGTLRRVREQLDRDGEVRDDATPKLREIRKRLKPLRGRIREALEALLQRHAEAVQDPIVTQRRDRYVIPIRASAQSRVPGIAVDASASGQTVFLEPQSVVSMNNELALLQFEERDEVRRILLELGRRLAEEPELDRTLEVVAELDLLNATARLAEDWRLGRPSFTDDGSLQLPDARHPLVEACVPNDLSLDAERRLLIVTGPNAGGKTVILKTLGLAACMAHAGLYVAAGRDGAAPRLPRFGALLVDIGDDQSIEASLSTYAGHLTNLGRIVREADADTLVLVDELGSGTDPEEGAALSQAILERILESGARGVITTHLAPLKVFAGDHDGVVNAAMRFDVDRLAPTFEMVLGQPGRSYALAIAERLGLPEDVLARAGELLGPEGERLERLLESLEAQREELTVRVRDAEGARDEAQREAEVLRTEIERLRAREEEVMADASARAEAMLEDTMQRATRLERTARGDADGRSRALEEIQALRREARQGAERRGPAAPPAEPAERLRAGARVHVPEYGASGPVLEVRGDTVLVQLGLLKVEVGKREVQLQDEASERTAKGGGPRRSEGAGAAIGANDFDGELNLRGERVEGALEQVRDFVSEAHALRVPSIRILHGKGTGALRDAVRNYLRDERKVERFEDAVPYEGGHGVTVAYLRDAGGPGRR